MATVACLVTWNFIKCIINNNYCYGFISVILSVTEQSRYPKIIVKYLQIYLRTGTVKCFTKSSRKPIRITFSFFFSILEQAMIFVYLKQIFIDAALPDLFRIVKLYLGFLVATSYSNHWKTDQQHPSNQRKPSTILRINTN